MLGPIGLNTTILAESRSGATKGILEIGIPVSRRSGIKNPMPRLLKLVGMLHRTSKEEAQCNSIFNQFTSETTILPVGTITFRGK
jgi:hypothetical protein